MNNELPKFDFNHPHAWALAREFYSNWIRQIASKYEIDVPKYMLGYVLQTIVGDDSNCFGPSCVPFYTDIAQLAKKYLITRMNWEIDLPETPVEIRKKLEDILPWVIETDLQNEEDFVEIRTKWNIEIKGFVEERISEKDQYKEAMIYGSEVSKVLHQEYEEFLYSEK